MGDRGEVCIVEGNSKVYLYTHWGAEKLPIVVQDALDSAIGRNRWSDGPHIARIIFDRMSYGKHDQETGFGITSVHMDAWRVITVDVDKQEVTIDDYPDAEDKGVIDKKIQKFTFKQFVGDE